MRYMRMKYMQLDENLNRMRHLKEEGGTKITEDRIGCG